LFHDKHCSHIIYVTWNYEIAEEKLVEQFGKTWEWDRRCLQVELVPNQSWILRLNVSIFIMRRRSSKHMLNFPYGF